VVLAHSLVTPRVNMPGVGHCLRKVHNFLVIAMPACRLSFVSSPFEGGDEQQHDGLELAQG
jgi:hypothetical protein